MERLQPGQRTEVGDTFVCPLCKKLSTVNNTFEELVAEYEMIFGKEFAPATNDLRLVCDNCTAEWKSNNR